MSPGGANPLTSSSVHAAARRDEASALDGAQSSLRFGRLAYVRARDPSAADRVDVFHPLVGDHAAIEVADD
jgi:hypothetical protein